MGCVSLENPMSDYRRNYVPGGTYFFTVVTALRRPILTTDFGRVCLREAMMQIKAKLPFTIFAIVLLPDHFHSVWTLPRGDTDYSTRWRQIKERFTRLYLEGKGSEVFVSASRRNKGERGVWQRRFWEHTVRDEEDLKRCVDYVHWNPCKHKVAGRVKDWPWSTFHRFVEQGEYDCTWGDTDPCAGYHTPEWTTE
jgi:putative transposase